VVVSDCVADAVCPCCAQGTPHDMSLQRSSELEDGSSDDYDDDDDFSDVMFADGGNVPTCCSISSFQSHMHER
jgi:hypothetical protein